MTIGPPSELLDLTGMVVIVTGAGGGVGAGIAHRFSQAGASVAAHTRQSPVDTSAFSGPMVTVTCDLTSEGGPAQVVHETVAAFGKVDALVNNAGIQTLAALPGMEDGDFRAMLDTNVTATHRLTQAVAAHLIGRSAPGSIVHVASIEGRQPAPMHGHYAVSKAALTMHARAAALEYGAFGIRVNTVSPGLISRPGLDEQWPEGVARWHSSAPLRRLGTPEDVGDACLFLVSPLARWITGVELVVDGGVLTRPTW
jgi:NAD(P)-dependent dehydrogenase (short-subunit alcohol dehydrogenase family)